MAHAESARAGPREPGSGSSRNSGSGLVTRSVRWATRRQGPTPKSRFGYEPGHPALLSPGNGAAYRHRCACARYRSCPSCPLVQQSPVPISDLVGPNAPADGYGTAAAGAGLVSVDLISKAACADSSRSPRGLFARLRRTLLRIGTLSSGLRGWIVRSSLPATPRGDAVVADTSTAWTGTSVAFGHSGANRSGGLHGQVTEFEVRFPWSGARRRIRAARPSISPAPWATRQCRHPDRHRIPGVGQLEARPRAIYEARCDWVRMLAAIARVRSADWVSRRYLRSACSCSFQPSTWPSSPGRAACGRTPW